MSIRTYATALGSAQRVTIAYVSLTDGKPVRCDIPLVRRSALSDDLSELALRAVYARAHHDRALVAAVSLTAPDGTMTDVTKEAMTIGFDARFPGPVEGPVEWVAAVAQARADVAAGLPVPPPVVDEDEDESAEVVTEAAEATEVGPESAVQSFPTPGSRPMIDPELLAAAANAASDFSTMPLPEGFRPHKPTVAGLLAESEMLLRRLAAYRIVEDHHGASLMARGVAGVLEGLACLLEQQAEADAPVTDAEPPVAFTTVFEPAPVDPEDAVFDPEEEIERLIKAALADRDRGIEDIRSDPERSAMSIHAAAEALRSASRLLHPASYEHNTDESSEDIPF